MIRLTPTLTTVLMLNLDQQADVRTALDWNGCSWHPAPADPPGVDAAGSGGGGGAGGGGASALAAQPKPKRGKKDQQPKTAKAEPYRVRMLG